MLGTYLFDKIVIDGKTANISEIDNNNGYVYLTAGNHNVEYTFKSSYTEIPSDLFQNCLYMTYLKIPENFTVADYALDGTNLRNINEYILNFPTSYYNDKYYVYIGPIKPTEDNIINLFEDEYTKYYTLDQLNDNLLVPESIGTFNINITNNYGSDKLYMCVWDGWCVESEMNRFEWPSLHDPENNYITIPNNITKEYIEFGQIRYIVLSFDWKGSGEYTCHLLDNYIGIAFTESYELYDENNEVIDFGECYVGSGFDKYYKGVGYCEVKIDLTRYYILEYHNNNMYNKFYDVYDDHLVKTNMKIKFSEYILEPLNP